jgi:trigger factor
VKLEYAEIKNEIEDAYKKERKSISMPGFRKGKVPMGMLKKAYGEAIEYKASEDIANKKFWDIVSEKDLKPLNMPSMTNLNFEMDKSLEFSVKYEVKPTLKLKGYKKLEIEKPVFKVREEDVENEVNNMLKSKATYKVADIIEDNNFRITVDLQRIDDKGKEIEGSKSSNMVIDLSDSKVNADIVQNAKKKKVGETFQFTFTDEHMHGTETHKEEFTYVATINKIEKINLPEPTEKLFQELSGKKAKSLDELKNITRENYEKYYTDQSDKMYFNSLLEKIVENNEFKPSEGYVDNIAKRLLEAERRNAQQQKVPHFDEEFVKQNLKPKAEWNAKWQIILENIAEKEQITVGDEDLEKLAKEEAGKTGISEEKLVKYYKDAGRLETLLEEKVLDFLKANNKAVEYDPEEKAKKEKAKVKKEKSSSKKVKETSKKSENKK